MNRALSLLLALALGLPLVCAAEGMKMLEIQVGEAAVADRDAFSEPDTLSGHLQYELFPYLDLSLGYHDFDKFITEGQTEAALEMYGPSVGGVLKLPIGGHSELFLRAETLFWHLTLYGADTKWGEDDGSSTLVGVGLRLGLGERLGIVMEASRIGDVSGVDIDRQGVGVYLRF